DQELEQVGQLLDQYAELLPKVISAESWQECEQLQTQLQADGLAPEIAFRFAILDYLTDFLPLIGMVETTDQKLDQLAQIRILVEEKIDSKVISDLLEKVPVLDSWDRRARESLVSSLYAANMKIVQQVALEAADKPQSFFAKRRQKMRALDGLRQKLVSEAPRNFHPFTVLLHALESLLTV
ncbi:MAG: NAD-glutamate dehydrogenase, partial [Desulfuromonadales bacterium]|nr:NAD-glutamate dehydrogenase [Desulfuromonadales bacterium]